MNSNTRKAFASSGLEILKEAVLDVLYEQYQYGNVNHIEFNAIHDALGIQRIDGVKDYLIHSILLRLREEGYAKRIGRNAWQITEKAIREFEWDSL